MATPRRPNRKVQLMAVLRKETLQTVRDRRVMALLIIAPLLQLIVFAYAVDFKVDRVPTVVVDQDQSAASREHLRRVLADGTLERTQQTTSTAEAERALEVGSAAVALVVPHGFQRALDRGETAEVQVLMDGSDPNRSGVAGSAVGRYFAGAGERLARQRAATLRPAAAGAPAGQLSLAPRIWYNPQLDSPPYMVSGVMAMLLVVVTTIVAAMGLARERESGTLEQVLVTPLRPIQLLIGKMLPFVVIGFFDVLLGTTVGAWLFGVPLRGSLAAIAVGTAFYLMCTLGVGLFISTISRTQQQSFLGGFLFAMPAILLSGVMTPIRAMPGWMQVITWFNPVRYYVEVLRGSLLKGSGFEQLWPQILTLFVFGAVLLGMSSLRFQKRIG